MCFDPLLVAEQATLNKVKQSTAAACGDMYSAHAYRLLDKRTGDVEPLVGGGLVADFTAKHVAKGACVYDMALQVWRDNKHNMLSN